MMDTRCSLERRGVNSRAKGEVDEEREEEMGSQLFLSHRHPPSHAGLDTRPILTLAKPFQAADLAQRIRC